MSLFRRDRGYPQLQPLTADERVAQLQQQLNAATSNLREAQRREREQDDQIKRLGFDLAAEQERVEKADDALRETEARFARLLSNSTKLVVELQDAWWMRAARAADAILDISREVAEAEGESADVIEGQFA